MNNNRVIYGIIFFILGVLCLMLSFNKKTYTINSNSINKNIKETFNDINSIDAETRNSVQEAIMKQQQEKQENKNSNNREVKNNTNRNTSFDLNDYLVDNNSNTDKNMDSNTDRLDIMITQLNSIEAKCYDLRNKQKKAENDEKRELEEERLAQLDLEDEKIKELEDMLQTYRKVYKEKSAISNKCRNEIMKNVKDQYNVIDNNRDKFKRGTKVNVNLDKSIKQDISESEQNNKKDIPYGYIDLDDKKYNTPKCDTDILKRDITKINEDF